MSNPNPNVQLINSTDARVFRITHIDNVAWLLDHGLHCQSSGHQDPNFVPIGMQTIIDRRRTYHVPIAPGGVLADYVPFYFTPWSMMLMNIKTGYKDVIQRPNSEIVIIVARIREFWSGGLSAVFSNGHALMKQTQYFSSAADLGQIDWNILQNRDFKKTEADTDKSRRYQAEALVHGHVPIALIRGIVCNTVAGKARVDGWAQSRGLQLNVVVRSGWYF